MHVRKGNPQKGLNHELEGILCCRSRTVLCKTIGVWHQLWPSLHRHTLQADQVSRPRMPDFGSLCGTFLSSGVHRNVNAPMKDSCTILKREYLQVITPTC